MEKDTRIKAIEQNLIRSIINDSKISFITPNKQNNQKKAQFTYSNAAKQKKEFELSTNQVLSNAFGKQNSYLKIHSNNSLVIKTLGAPNASNISNVSSISNVSFTGNTNSVTINNKLEKKIDKPSTATINLRSAIINKTKESIKTSFNI